MNLDELKWTKDASLGTMTARFNSVVDMLKSALETIEALNGQLDAHTEDTDSRLHALDDRILNVNYKVDDVERDLVEKIDGVKWRISMNHPGS